ncbi:MAG TPA: hypothetical protein VFY29_04935 [Terriglobia bacterium]|nr:hypothetical protein [Terriglobia bacterium]
MSRSMSAGSKIIRKIQTVIAIGAITALAAGVTAQGIAPGGSISGRLTLRNGKPGAGRRVMAVEVVRQGAPPDRPAVTTLTAVTILTLTDAQGRFLLEDVPLGRYVIATGLLDDLTFFPGTLQENQATIVTVANGARVADIDFRLSTVMVSGRVIGDLEAALPSLGRGVAASALVRGPDLRLGTDPVAPKAPVDREGAFQFSAVPPGKYRPMMGATAGVGILSTELVVGDDDISGVQLRAARLMKFPVIVAVEGGVATPPLRLRFENARASDNPAPVVVEATGTASFDVSLPDIQYRLAFPETPPGLVVKSATLVYPSGGTTSILQKPFVPRQVARLEIVLTRN